MSLVRFLNSDSILKLNIPQYGQLFSDKDLNALQSIGLIPSFVSIEAIRGSLVPEIHVYTFDGDLLGSSIDSSLHVNVDNKNLFIDVREIFNLAKITTGSYKLAFNLLVPVYGRPSAQDPNNASWPVLVKEISPFDRREVKFTITGENQILAVQQFRDYIESLSAIDLLNNLVVNFGNNRINKIINIYFDKDDQNVFYIRLYDSVDDSVEELDKAWFAVELMDPYIDTVVLSPRIRPADTIQIAGPRFDINVDQWDSQATVYQSWNDLLDNVDAPTTQRLIDELISGSGQATLNIDYTDYNNYIFYSSAAERLANFRYKMGLIESYSVDNSTLLASSGSGSTAIAGAMDINTNRINTITQNFDAFERWMYYHETGSIFTHGLSGSQTPWPKYKSGSRWINHHVTSSLAQTWYTNNHGTASLYDQSNHNSLWWSIPEHVLMDDNNSQYITFVNMIGQHFDNVYSYVHALTQIHNKDEHPERGPSDQLLYYIAKHFGWNLQNTRQLSSLWLYKLGTDESGSLLETSNMDVLPHEKQTFQIWRRIINNLPYLLKTKGTSRSIKALMSIYGIPQTLISIKEYGGPGIDPDRPIFIENRFGYKLLVNSGSHVTSPRDFNVYADNGWKGNAWCEIPSSSLLESRSADTIEFRFSTTQSGSSDSILVYSHTDGNTPLMGVYLNGPLLYTGSLNVSGSEQYGKVQVELFDSSGTSYESGSTDYLPIFDGDLWTVRLYKQPTASGSGDYNFQIAKVSDCLYGRVAHEAAFTMSADFGQSFNPTSTGSIHLGGASSAILTAFSSSNNDNNSVDQFTGAIQSYKEYYTIFDNQTFYNHVLNPGAYNVDSISGSFYSLYKYFPLGLDVQRWDHANDYLVRSSSQPDQTISPSPLTFVDFTGDQEDHYESATETHYAKVPSLGGNVLMGEKIRLEDNSYKFELDPVIPGETSAYDEAPIDTNRLAIVFSLADQVNRDIGNHMGFEELDSWIGDPEYEFENSYDLLRVKRNEYFQKYQQKNDINSFIRLLSLYDYSFFEQIRQLVPARADLIAGILIEPNILERSKVHFTKRPTVRNLTYSDTIDTRIYSQSGYVPTWNDDVSATGSIDIVKILNSGSIVYDPVTTINKLINTGSVNLRETSSIDYCYLSSSIDSPFLASASKVCSDVWCGDIDIINPYSGSTGCTQSIIDNERPDCRYKIKECVFLPFTQQTSRIDNSFFNTTSSWYLGSGSTYYTSSVTYIGVEGFKLGNYISLDSVNSYLSQSITTDPNADYVIRIFTRKESGEARTNKVDVFVNDVLQGENFGTQYTGSRAIRPEEFHFTGSGTDIIKLTPNAPPNTDYKILGVEIYTYLSKYQKEWAIYINRDCKVREVCVLKSGSYQIDECSSRNNSRYLGSKLTGPGINIDSPNTSDGGPVIVRYESNPNEIFTGNGGNQGNLRLE